MPRPVRTLLALAAVLPAALASAAVPAHDMVACVLAGPAFVVGTKTVVDSGLFRRGPDGLFHHFGLNFPYIYSVSYDPRDARVIYAASLNGCLVTRDGGLTWRIATSWDMTEPQDVHVDPNSPDTVYIALPDGVAQSSDRGLTWQRREHGLPDRGKYTQVLSVDRTRAGRVLAGCESGIYLTENAGRSWRRVLATSETVNDVEQSPHDPLRWIAATQSDGLVQSRDGGRTWQPVPGVPSANSLYNVAFDPTDSRRIAVGSWTYGVLASEDDGRTWADRNTGLPAGHCVYRVGVDPDSGRLYAGVHQVALYQSDDFGRTWAAGGLPQSRIYRFVFIPAAQ